MQINVRLLKSGIMKDIVTNRRVIFGLSMVINSNWEQLYLRITPLLQNSVPPMNTQCSVKKFSRIGFLDSFLCRQSVYNCTNVQQYISACIGGNLKLQFRRVLRHLSGKFSHRTSCIHVGNTILDVMGWFTIITLVWHSLVTTAISKLAKGLLYLQTLRKIRSRACSYPYFVSDLGMWSQKGIEYTVCGIIGISVSQSWVYISQEALLGGGGWKVKDSIEKS